ncbi:T9SS type A sorting domain-containing protein [Myroides guanonis]|uniref:Secretion system C-terminal sorting domain-containing protein n=1 Tax=Myroides guanonis TaxID=1150112 RepID=A0A1I3MA70_9FLAO|nr:T9SS type A sorting domain-containing protein [Myroides guanonis]SFI93878.1 hypothetical protein SAMN04487893_10292 [Myroides guanonis]
MRLFRRFLLGFLMIFYCGSAFSQSVILEENFDSVLGSGGNDANWSGSIAGSPMSSLGSWTILKGFKGFECLKLGTTTQKGELTTPFLTGLNGDAVLTFSAGAWNAITEKTSIQLDIIGGGILSASSVLLTKGGFSSYSISIIGGTPLSQIVFRGEASNNSRFFIDSIKIVSDAVTSVPEIITTQVDGVYGSFMSEVITVSNSPTSFNVVGPIPTGVSFSMGTFSGTPIETGVFPINVVASNALGNSVAKSISIIIDKADQSLINTEDVVLDINQTVYSLFEKTNANLKISYSVLDTTIANVNANILQVKGIGVTKIIASQKGNQYYKELKEELLLVVLQDTPDCGVEDFVGISLPSSYSDGTFIGNNNVVWNYVECRNENSDVNGSGIDGSAIMLRRLGDESRVYSSKISTGIGSFSAKLYKGFTGSGNRQVELFINGESKGMSIPFDDYSEHLFTVDSINISGDIVIELRNVKSMQVIVDDIEWTCYHGSVGKTIWDGISWSNGKPNRNAIALIKGDFKSQGDLEVHSLEVESGIEFVLNSNDELIVGDITNNGVIVFSNGSNVLQEKGAVNSGNVKVEIETVPLKRLDYMVFSAPVNGQNLHSFSSRTLHNRFYNYDTFSNSFVNGGIDSISSFEVGRAYGIRTPNDFTVIPQIFKGVFKGPLNNDEVKVTISSSGLGFNLIGNPYPSLIDLDAFFEENKHIDASAYIYVNANDFDEIKGEYKGSNYAVYNKLGAVSADNSSFVPTSFLNTSEGFVVKANIANDILFTNDMRISNKVDSSLVVNTNGLDRYWLGFKDIKNQSFSQVLIGYVEGGTDGVDRLYDASILTENSIGLTTLLHGHPYLIQGRSFPFSKNDKVNLRFVVKQSGDYVISLLNTDGVFFEGQDIYLKDHYLKRVVCISEDAYTFYSEVGVFDDRFEIIYEDSLLSIADFSSEDNEVYLYVKERYLKVGVRNKELSRVSLLDIQGKVIYDSGVLGQSEFEINCSTYAKGKYFVRIELKDAGVQIKKIIL